jgi:TonB family protein
MNKLFHLTISFILLLNTPATCQENRVDFFTIKEEIPVYPGNGEFFTLIEGMPEYPGGDVALLRFISEKVRYPEICKANGIMGFVFVSYIVNTSGGVEDVKISCSSNELFNKEAIRVVKSITGYKPARQGGKPVPCQFTIPIQFVLTNDDAESQAQAVKALAIEYYNLGTKEFSEKNYGLAEFLFGQALKNTSNWFYESFLARGKTRVITSKYDKALKDFESALKIKPDLIDAHLDMAKTYILLKDKSNAISSLQQALSIDSSSVNALQHLSELHYSNFEYDLALGYYEKLTSLNQTNGLAYYFLGICYAKKRNVPTACEKMRTAYNLGVKDAELFVENFCMDK